MNTVLQNQLTIMLQLQNEINSKVNPDWRKANQNWQRAIWIESAEMLEHFGWKWWKKQNPDMAQVHLELIDIWHFGLSMLVEQFDGDYDASASMVDLERRKLKANNITSDSSAFAELVERFVVSTLTTDDFQVYSFLQLMTCVDLSIDQLYVMYVGKNVLNTFRQDNGYKDGSYVKIWNGLEDNEVLVNVMNVLDPNDLTFPQLVRQGLQAKYSQIV